MSNPARPTEHGFTPSQRSAEHGFTLVEVMVSLLIFAMLAAGGVAILSFSVRAQKGTSARLDDMSALNRSVSILSADLAQASNRAARDEGGTLMPAFVGEADGSMRFVRAGWSNVDAAPRASSQKVAYHLAGNALERTAYPMIDGAQPMTPVKLLDRVEGVSARYRFRGAWSDRWDGGAGAPLPDAVEINIARAGGRNFRAMMLVGTGYALLPPQGAFGAAG